MIKQFTGCRMQQSQHVKTVSQCHETVSLAYGIVEFNVPSLAYE